MTEGICSTCGEDVIEDDDGTVRHTLPNGCAAQERRAWGHDH